jgi:hypothetical protein
MSPYWTRVYDLVNILESSPEDTLVVYLDADAIPIHKNISIPQFIASLKLNNIGQNRGDFYVSEDPNVRFDIFYRGIFNSGVYIVKNTAENRKLAKKWLSMYNNGHEWVLKGNGSWSCKINGRTCFWSLKGYEQYALTELYKKYPFKFTRLHWTTLACDKPGNKHCFIMHLMGHNNDKRLRIFKEHYSKNYSKNYSMNYSKNHSSINSVK